MYEYFRYLHEVGMWVFNPTFLVNSLVSNQPVYWQEVMGHVTLHFHKNLL